MLCIPPSVDSGAVRWWGVLRVLALKGYFEVSFLGGDHGDSRWCVRKRRAATRKPGVTSRDLKSAADRGDVVEAQQCVNAGVDVNGAENLVGYSLLHDAVLDGNEQRVEVLLAVGTNVSQPSKSGRTPLHLAAEKGRATIAKMLLRAGASTEASCFDAGTPLMAAVVTCQPAVVELLLAAGARTNVVDPVKGLTPLQWAQRYREQGARATIYPLLRHSRLMPNGGSTGSPACNSTLRT